VETQNTPASYQSGAAGVISLVSKSGGDHFHGDAFGVFRPDILAANDYFNKQSQLANVDPVTGAPAPYNTPPSFTAIRKADRLADPSCTRSFSSLATMKLRSRSFSTVQTSFLFPPPRSEAGIFPPTATQFMIRRSLMWPPDRWLEHANPSRATRLPTPIPSR